MPTQKQVDAGVAVATQVAHSYVNKYAPALFKGTAEGYINDHPELFKQLVVEIYEAMEKAK